MVKEINRSGATFLFVAITSPKKEKFINRYREKLGVKFVMGVGGAFEIMAGITQRAPTWNAAGRIGVAFSYNPRASEDVEALSVDEQQVCMDAT